ncbi:MATE family efflux transporter [Fulvimarina sp. MAC8]|uniref:MATE family efflux transporter n=1 Tax=Fulvimarina sp. MAC8 TaxID=3162874 RepID=UPI0032ED23FE
MTQADLSQSHAAATRQTLFQLSFPIFLSSLLTFTTMLVEMAIISSFSADAAAAIAISRQVLQIGFEVSAMIGIGAVILISHRLGRADHAGTRQIAVIAVVSNGLLGLFIGLVIALFGPMLLGLLDTPSELMPDARAYMFIMAAAMVFQGLGAAAMASLRAYGKSRTIVMIALALGLFYMAAQYVLILGFGPVPAMGVVGAAWGAFLLRVAMALLFGLALYREIGVYSLAGMARSWIGQIRNMLALSFPSVSDYIAYGFYQLILLGFISAFGIADVLARTYVMIAMTFLILVIMAVSQGNEVLLGYRRGEGKSEEAYAQALRSAMVAAVTTVALATLLWQSAPLFISLFSADAEVFLISQRLFFLTILIQPGFALNTILLQSLRAVGDVKVPVISSVAITFGIGLPLAWMFCTIAGLGVEGVWIAMIVEETLKAFYMLHRWRARRWFDASPA